MLRVKEFIYAVIILLMSISIIQNCNNIDKKVNNVKDGIGKVNTFVEKRDGKSYKTVKIGSQIWMAENLAYKPESGKYYPENENATYVDEYGYLYEWNTAMKSCPEGWHLPSEEEWLVLINYLGGENNAGGKMKSTYLWENPNTGATNEVGFNAKPGGNMEGKDIGDKTNFDLVGVGNIATFWTSSEFHEIWAKYFVLYSFNGAIGSSNFDKGEAYLSVRCIKDE
jgi:uncharacterized protein (TIGR02145 family)